MNLTNLQKEIVEIIKESQNIKIEEIASKLGVAKSDIKTDLALLNAIEVIGYKNETGYYYHGRKNYILFAELLKSYPVENIMSMPVIIEDKTSIYDAIVTLFLENVGSIYITRNDALVGVVSRKDLLRSSIGNIDLNQTPINIVMTRMPNIRLVYKDTSVYECAKIITKSQIDGVPVVEEIMDTDGSKQYKVIGRVTKTNITNMFVRMGNDYNVEEIL